MLDKIINLFLLRYLRLALMKRQLSDALAAEATEEVFKLLLRVMAFFFVVDRAYRKNLAGFAADYLFATESGRINVAVTFRNNRMSVYEETIDNYNVRVDFVDYRAVIAYLTDPDPDLLDQLLNQKLDFSGNLNYLYKFVYMSRHLLHNLGLG